MYLRRVSAPRRPSSYPPQRDLHVLLPGARLTGGRLEQRVAVLLHVDDPAQRLGLGQGQRHEEAPVLHHAHAARREQPAEALAAHQAVLVPKVLRQ
jgi:hypothetical protein